MIFVTINEIHNDDKDYTDENIDNSNVIEMKKVKNRSRKKKGEHDTSCNKQSDNNKNNNNKELTSEQKPILKTKSNHVFRAVSKKTIFEI